MTTIKKVEKKCIMQTYSRYPLDIARARGMHIWDSKGKEYLDFFSGLAVTNLGHTHPGIVRAIKDQAGKYLHVGRESSIYVGAIHSTGLAFYPW